uniref:UPF0420 protein n=1 Tax=Panagrellus redivivus TaxID=6233 RepID=A0A7E4UWT7_PANRE
MPTLPFIEEYSGEVVRQYTSPDAEPTVTKKKDNLPFLAAIKSFFITVFLPQGYPHTVTPDYLEYQCWDTIQAFASSLTHAISTSAVLKGVGVGNQEATVLAASLTWLIRDGVGMVGSIVFAWAKGTELDSNCKRWRLVADILNDLSHLLELAAPHLSTDWFIPITCGSSLLRAVVGVAGGATRTAVTRHQARRENLADVAAKDGSQETLVNIMSLLVSLSLLPALDGADIRWSWGLSLLFVGIHIFANWRAVRVLRFDTVNQNRLAICVRSYIATKTIPSITEANQAEPLFWRVGPMRQFGCDIPTAYRFSSLEGRFFAHEPKNTPWILTYYIFRPDHEHGFIVLRHDATSDDQLDAAISIEMKSATSNWPEKADIIAFKEAMAAKNWDLTSHHLDFDEWRYRSKAQ